MTARLPWLPSLRAAPLAWLFWLVAAACALYAGWRDGGTTGIIGGVARLAYVAAAVLLIYRLTRGVAEPTPRVRRLWIELVALAVYFVWLALALTAQVRRLDFSQYAVGYPAIERFLRAGVARPLNAALGWEGWPAARLNDLLLNLATQFVIPLALFLLLGYGARALGLRLRWAWLALPLAALTLIYAAATGGITAPVGRIAPGVLFQIGIVGLPRELWARSLLQTRLEALFRHPLHGIAAAAVLYGLMHLPAAVRLLGSDWPRVLAVCLGQQAAVGFALGYLWRRTRSLAPGVLWHAFAAGLT